MRRKPLIRRDPPGVRIPAAAHLFDRIKPIQRAGGGMLADV
jgi:hypothetical protein